MALLRQGMRGLFAIQILLNAALVQEEAFLNSLPIASWWPGMFEANGDCTKIDWQFLNLTIPDWSLLAFITMTATGLFLVLNNRKIKRK